MSGIYIHIPFCKQACSYCDFYFSTRQQFRQPFVDALVREIQLLEGSKQSEDPIKSIYIGGGTPSLLNQAQLGQIFKALENTFDLQPEEVTMELNPDDVSVDYLEMIRGFGINRASMGVQSFQPELLTFMHRAHNPQEALFALEALQKAGFTSFTADLIYGNPGQTLGMLDKDIEQLLSFNPPHISAYSLTVEPKTKLGKQVQLGRILPPDDEEVAKHFDFVRQKLESNGIIQYEVSNFARPGKEAVHNSSYWTHENYTGLGPSAHSFWWDDKHARRWKNRPDLNYYMENSPDAYRHEIEDLSPEIMAEERLMLGLRTKWGVSENEINTKYGYSYKEKQLQWIDHQVAEKMLTFEDGLLTLTSDGLKIADLLIVDLLSKG